MSEEDEGRDHAPLGPYARPSGPLSDGIASSPPPPPDLRGAPIEDVPLGTNIFGTPLEDGYSTARVPNLPRRGPNRILRATAIGVAVAVLLGLAALVRSSRQDAGPGGGLSAATDECAVDVEALTKAIATWNRMYLAEDPDYRTPYPMSEAALTASETRLLATESQLHDLIGDGANPPTIVYGPTCADRGPIAQPSAAPVDPGIRVACEADSKLLLSAVETWNMQYQGGQTTVYSTPWPPTEQALTATRTKLLNEESDLHDLIGGGSYPPAIVKAAGKCVDEGVIVQPTEAPADPTERVRCEGDTQVLLAAIETWHGLFEAGAEAMVSTPWPPSEDAMTRSPTAFLAEESDLHDLIGNGGGAGPPTIVVAPGQCADELVEQPG